MKWINNLMIRWKLILGFGIVIVLIVALSGVSVVISNSVDVKYTYLLDFPQHRLAISKDVKQNFTDMRRLAVTAILESGNIDLVNSFIEQFNQAYNSACENIDAYIKSNDEDTLGEPADLEDSSRRMRTLKTKLTEYKTQVMEPASAYAIAENQTEGMLILRSGGAILNEATEIVNELCNESAKVSAESSAETTAYKDMANLLFMVFAGIVVLLSVVIAFVISRMLTAPLNRLLDIANNLAKGNLSINKSATSKDEIGQLTLDMYILADVIKSMINDLLRLNHVITIDGDYDHRLETGKYEGAYREMTMEINNFADEYVADLNQLTALLEQIGYGNFDVKIKKYPGKKASINSRTDSMITTLKSMYAEMINLAGSASEGKLGVRVDAKKYQGEWASLCGALNLLMGAIAAPIEEAAVVLRQVSVGDFHSVMIGEYRGDFLIIKDSINNTVTNVASYINEISSVLSAMSDHNDLNQSISREYVGKFSEIKGALNNIIDKFNSVIFDIYTSANQVASGAKMISDSSMVLAQATSEQAASVEELNAAILTINEITRENEVHAIEAENLSVASKDNAQNGDRDMKDMLASMEEINKSSNNIAKIIKKIDDITFQTNLLALNAAVEAARAGVHGKGFNVVAEEVRSLAGKSLTASKEIADLIEESITRIDNGSKAAETTAEGLHTIVDDVEKVSVIITNITKSSHKQTEAIGNVTAGLSQITEVVQNNSATTEETASAAQELSSQAEVLKTLAGKFKLKRV